MVIDSLSYEVLEALIRLDKFDYRRDYFRLKRAVLMSYSDLRSKITHETDDFDRYEFVK